MRKNKEIIRAIKFTIFSASAGIIELELFTVLDSFTKFNYCACYLPALIASIVWNFTLNRNYTFKASNNVPIAMLKVGLFYLVFTPTSTILGNFLAESLHWNGVLVTIINMLLNFVLEFLYDRFYVFKDSIDTKTN